MTPTLWGLLSAKALFLVAIIIVATSPAQTRPGPSSSHRRRTVEATLLASLLITAAVAAHLATTL